MDFSFPLEYSKYKSEVISFAINELNDYVIEADLNGEFPERKWKKCADFGIQGLAVPKKYGGQLEDVNFERAMLAMEGLGHGCKDNGLSFGLNAQMWTVQTPIVHFGTEEQKNRFLPGLANGSIIGSHALTEESAGSDIYNMQTTASITEGGYLLNGKKRLITLGPISDLALVFANANPKVGKWGVTAFLVERESEGFKQNPVQSKMGMRSIPIGELEFQDCFVPDGNVLGKEGMGFSILNHSLEYDRCCILASQLGAMERQLEESIEFVKSRDQFGQAVGKFQSVSNRIADMKLRLETSRLLLYKVAWLKSQGTPAVLETAMLKLHLSESFTESSIDAIRNQGGMGYLTENETERNLRDALGGLIYAGTSDIQRNIISKMLGL